MLVWCEKWTPLGLLIHKGGKLACSLSKHPGLIGSVRGAYTDPLLIVSFQLFLKTLMPNQEGGKQTKKELTLVLVLFPRIPAFLGQKIKI